MVSKRSIPPPPALAGLFVQTLQALLAPRRLLPILLVCGPMVAAQARFSSRLEATWVAVLICVLFIALGPFAWRALFPRGQRLSWLLLRLLVYGALGAFPAFVGWYLPQLLELGRTFIGAGINLVVSGALFWVGGWGLARDIDLERGLRQQQARVTELEREAERAQLMALRANLDPHFLFNTLNAIAEWCRQDGAMAEQAILKLSALLREVLQGVKVATWPLAHELELARDLLELHRIRDPSRFKVAWDVPADLPQVPVPPLLFLPLVENAVKHGPAAGHHGDLELTVAIAQEELRLVISNPGPFNGPRDGGEGLAIVQRRLTLLYGAAGSLRVEGQGDRTRVELVVPMLGPASQELA